MRYVSIAAVPMIAIAIANAVQAQAPGPDAVKLAEEAKAESEAKTAYWAAKQAEYEAEAAAVKSKLAGLDGLNPAAGATELAEKGGEIEAEMLATLAARRAADAIVSDVAPKAPGMILLLAPTQSIVPHAWYSFQAKAFGVERAMRAQGCPARAAPVSPPETSLPEASLPGVLAAVNVAAKLFKSDLSVSGVEVSAQQDLLLRAVAAAFLRDATKAQDTNSAKTDNTANGPTTTELVKREVLLPAASAANVLTPDNPVMQKMAELDDLLQCIDAKLAAGNGAAPALEAERARHAAFVADVTQPSDSGVIELVEAARQAAWAPQLKTAHVLRVEAHKAGGSLFRKTNLWTALGVGKPFQISSGLVVSYELTRPLTGQLVAAGSVACASGFHRITDAHRTVDGRRLLESLGGTSACRQPS